SPGLATCLTQHPAPQGYDQAISFGIGYEPAWGNRALGRMMPADQGFQPCDPAAANIDLGLVNETKLVGYEGITEFFGQSDPRTNLGIHAISEEVVASPLSCLGA